MKSLSFRPFGVSVWFTLFHFKVIQKLLWQWLQKTKLGKRDVQCSTFTVHTNMVLSKQNNLKTKTNMGKLKGTQLFYIMEYSITIHMSGSHTSATASSVTIIWWPVTAGRAWPIPARRRRRTGTTTGWWRPGLWTAGVWRGGWAGSINQSRNSRNK